MTLLVQAHDLAMNFDVSAPWLNRVVEGAPRLLLHAVDGVSFDIARGKTLALVGESGCGKSTVARLLVGLHHPTRGGFTFDGQDAHAVFKTAQGNTLRRRIQMIFQDPYASLNPRWIVEDIVGEPLTEHGLISDRAALRLRVEELLQSVGLAAADRLKYPHQFSGGQRQRISIARAILKNAPLLLLDEATSALDSESERAVQAALDEAMRGRTTLVIAHRLGTVMHADRIVVLEAGSVVDAGTHAELLARSPLYQRLAAAQFSGRPLAAPESRAAKR